MTSPAPSDLSALAARAVRLYRRRDGGWSAMPLRGTGREEGRWLSLVDHTALLAVAQKAKALLALLTTGFDPHDWDAIDQEARDLRSALTTLEASQ